MHRGEIYLVNLADNSYGSEQSGIRPALIIQNDAGNTHSPTTIIVPITSKDKSLKSTHVGLSPSDGVLKESTVLCEQVRTIDKTRVIKRLGEITNQAKINDVNNKLLIAMGLRN